MTKNEIAGRTLKEIRPRLDNYVAPYSEEADWEEIVIAALQERLPKTDIKTCEDFPDLKVACCDTCHTFYPQYDMNVIDFPDGSKAWLCDPVKDAIYSERLKQVKQR